jgi:hypothetical protein
MICEHQQQDRARRAGGRAGGRAPLLPHALGDGADGRRVLAFLLNLLLLRLGRRRLRLRGAARLLKRALQLSVVVLQDVVGLGDHGLARLLLPLLPRLHRHEREHTRARAAHASRRTSSSAACLSSATFSSALASARRYDWSRTRWACTDARASHTWGARARARRSGNPFTSLSSRRCRAATTSREPRSPESPCGSAKNA